jgi:hypothetical protein
MKCSTQVKWVIFLFFTLKLFAFSSEDEVQSLLSKGKIEAESGNFTVALSHFNTAMGYLRQVSSSHPLVQEVQKEIRIARGRSLVSKFKNRSGLKPRGKSELLSLQEETEDVRVSQCFGKVLVREIWYPRDINRKGELFGFGRRLTILPSSGVEVSLNNEPNYVIRSVEAASFEIDENQDFDFHSGSFCLSSLEKKSRCSIKSPLAGLFVESDGPFAIMLAVTTNGGLKIIGLLGEIELKQKPKKSISLRPGQLVFSLTDGFSRKMNVELSTLMVTSKLMTAFDEPPAFYKKLKQQALIQALRTKKRFKTVVGDAKTNSDFQIHVLEEK